MQQPFQAKDLAFIVPTKDRPEKIKTLLESLSKQTKTCGRVIVVATGMDIRETVETFCDRLRIEYHYSKLPGQIRQRNFGISLLDETSPLVGFLDDDIVLNKDAIESMIQFWNQADRETAGVGFNIVNEEPFRPSKLKILLGAGSVDQGRVFQSGSNTPVTNVPHSIQTQWLNGGATVWKTRIIRSHPQKIIDGPWAIFEDLIYSYPIGKKYPLYICKEAQVRHEHIVSPMKGIDVYRFRGKANALWKLYFVKNNEDLSVKSYLWLNLFASLGGLAVNGVIKQNRSEFLYNLGKLEGLIQGIAAVMQDRELIELLEKKIIP